MGRIPLLIALLVLVLAGIASGHVERASYWPDPAPDRSVKPATGGKVPKARSLFTALRTKPRGRTHVVCAADSMQILRASLRRARKKGYKLRPTERSRKVKKRQARRLLAFNRKLKKACAHRSIQAAVNRARNNDRIVIMPGLYTEPKSRAVPDDDPRCKNLKQQNDEGDSDALSYAYQYRCPHAQNLIAVMGRRPGKGKDPQPPLWDRYGIPNLGRCIRCNVQMEGSGISPDDVIVEAGDASKGDGGPSGAGHKKDVGIRADRADGFVIRNLKVRHAREHNIYILESDGYRAERIKTYYPGEYGILTFVEDHGLIQHCDAAGAGDAGLYPGASVDTGEQTIEKKGTRYGQEIRFCDMRHNALGYSGTTSNAVWVHHNNFYDNGLGLSTDVFTASGHPGFPTDSMLIEKNNFYSNNFNPFVEGSDVEPTIPMPVGTGMWIAGGNNHTVRQNRFWDNWRRGTMTFAVPDALVCGDNPAAEGNQQAGCEEKSTSTSHRNRQYLNVMGVDPKGNRDPNGTDFWWDSFPGNRNNCWFDNVGPDETPETVTTSPPTLPRDCATSTGTGDPVNQEELSQCLFDVAAEREDVNEYGDGVCPWFTTPPEPQ